MSRTDRDPIRRPARPVIHRSDEYTGHEQLLRMQREHFWYVGRHRFLFHALNTEVRQPGLRAIDLGGGCGGWLAYVHERRPELFTELALGDSSLEALEFAGPVIADFAGRYQVDLYDLDWKDRWDVIFLLDVLEHLHDDAAVIEQVTAALRPGGLLFVTSPALPYFHSYNDDLVHHLRRYTRADFAQLAARSNLILRRSRYFMFFLSPLVLARRLMSPKIDRMTPAETRALMARTHAIPPAPLNQLLRFIFSLETPLGWPVPFPWGTSILGVFQKPR